MYCLDRQFFTDYVVPTVLSKMQLDIVDHWAIMASIGLETEGAERESALREYINCNSDITVIVEQMKSPARFITTHSVLETLLCADICRQYMPLFSLSEGEREGQSMDAVCASLVSHVTELLSLETQGRSNRDREASLREDAVLSFLQINEVTDAEEAEEEPQEEGEPSFEESGDAFVAMRSPPVPPSSSMSMAPPPPPGAGGPPPPMMAMALGNAAPMMD
ncbi:hypothetical protein KIPB_009163 [Kipferlia bialata]|uniref:Uncharacterized protein n=1 Tax=Kipferlia bialata TaxID=797122 RepID=A0A9K3D175_9EUKA|nr:hypothetical protein KIPB_009163 [Kipferlia bialata]|eukprot:g9163.t1